MIGLRKLLEMYNYSPSVTFMRGRPGLLCWEPSPVPSGHTHGNHSLLGVMVFNATFNNISVIC